MSVQSTTRVETDLGTIRQTVEAVTANRDLAKVTFNMTARSTGGVTALIETGALVQAGASDSTRVGQFAVSSDEPVALMGTNTAISPAEYILTGLAACYTVTLASLAAARHITLDSVQMTLDFDIDLSGFLGIDHSVRNGAEQIAISIAIDSPDASRKQLEELVEALEATSPIRDTIANPVKVSTNLR